MIEIAQLHTNRSARKISRLRSRWQLRAALSKLHGAFRHPERSEMSDVRSCKGGTVRTESKDLAPYLHSSLLTPHSWLNSGVDLNASYSEDEICRFGASPRFVILSGEKRRMWDNECQNRCDLSRRISAKPPPSFLITILIFLSVKFYSVGKFFQKQ